MTLTLVAALVLMLGTAGALLYGYLRTELTRQFDEVLRVKGTNLAGLLRQENGKVNFDFSDNTMPEFSVSRAPEYFQLWSQEGTSVERSESLGKKDLGIDNRTPNLPRTFDVKLPDGRDGRAFLAIITPSSENNNEGNSKPRTRPKPQSFILAVARDRAALDRTLATIGLADVSGIALLTLSFGVLVPLLIARNLKPLIAIAAQANQIDAHSLGNRFPVETMPTELRPICARLNDSLARLQGAFERERRFSGDVAHELRTPIAELRLLADLGVKHSDSGSSARRSFQDALEVAIQMEHIVESLLEMMAPDARTKPDELESVNLSHMIDQAWRPLEPEATRKEIALDRQSKGDITVPSNPTMLGRIIANLLSNAVEYSPAKSAITCQQEARPGYMIVTVTNTTDDLSAEDMGHLAEPFWRKDAARTSGRHAGLGLTLVARYAQRLGILVKWSLPSANVFQVELEIPR
jgi:two-component system sensor histidine kinase QseC